MRRHPTRRVALRNMETAERSDVDGLCTCLWPTKHLVPPLGRCSVCLSRCPPGQSRAESACPLHCSSIRQSKHCEATIDDYADSSRDATSPSSLSFRWAGGSIHRGTIRLASSPSGSIVRLDGPISTALVPSASSQADAITMARLSRGPLERRENFQESPRQKCNTAAGRTYARGRACSRGDQLLSCR